MLAFDIQLFQYYFKTLKYLVKDLDKENLKGRFQRHFSLKKINPL